MTSWLDVRTLARRIPMTTRRAGIVLVCGVALAGCGGDESGSGTEPAGDTREITAVSTTSPTVEDSAGTAAPTVSTPATADAPAANEPTGGASQCAVAITGDVTAEWTSSASGFQAFVYGGWLNNPSPEDASAFAVNCYDDEFNIVSFFASPGTEIPMEPATYQLTGSGSDAGPIAADMALLFDEGLWETTSGTLEIVEFDDRHIRATFSLAIHDSFDPTRTAEVTGEFAHPR